MVLLNCLVTFIFLKLTDTALVHKTFVIEYFSGSPDGVYKKTILGINGEFPGPVIEAQIGDTLQVDVLNRIQDQQNTSIHWHGIYQKETPWEDGVAYVTQCPIAYLQTQRYSFILKQAGTFWYHAHVRSQYTEGMWGVLIVHNHPERYSYDGHIIITLSDWYHRTAHENEQWYLFPNNGLYPYPDSVLINGVGRYICPYAIHSCNISQQVRPVFKVQAEKTYRVHVVNSAAVVTFNFSIDGHPLQVIESDSVDVKKGVSCDVASLSPGQRYSFLITTKKMETTRFLIRGKLRKELLFHKLAEVKNNNMYTELMMEDPTAVLEYSDEDSFGFEPFSYLDKVPDIDKELRPLVEMELATWDSVYAPRKYDVQLVLMVKFTTHTDNIGRGHFNDTPLILPELDKPILMSVMDGDEIPKDIYHFEIGNDQIVQIIINNGANNAAHSFHLHGHDFWVMGVGDVFDGNFEASRHNQTLKRTGPKRDTIMVERRSWAVIRFIADNPGVWLFHCHIDWHKLTGMSVAIVVGRKELQNMKANVEAYNVCKYSTKYNIANTSANDVDLLISSKVAHCVKIHFGVLILWIVIDFILN